MTDEVRIRRLRDEIFRVCGGADADEAIRALASAMTTMILAATVDRTAALAAFDRAVVAMRKHLENAGRPPGTPIQ
jgi:hypothetical protein